MVLPLVLFAIAICAVSTAQEIPTPQENIIDKLLTISAEQYQFESTYTINSDYLNSLSALLENYKTELQTVLNEEIFIKDEFPKASDLEKSISGVVGTQCFTGYIKNIQGIHQLGFGEYNYCAGSVKEDINEIRLNLTRARSKYQNEKDKTQSLLDNCILVYRKDYNLQEYQKCVSDLFYNFLSKIKIYKVNVRGKATQDAVIDLGGCADKLIEKVEPALNEALDTLYECFLADPDVQIQNIVLPTIKAYNVDLSHIKVKDALQRAIGSLQKNVDRTLDNTAKLKALVLKGYTIYNRSLSYNEKVLELLDEVNAYRRAFLQAFNDLSKMNYFNISRSCYTAGVEAINRNINARAAEMNDILIFVYNINAQLSKTLDLQSNLKMRIMKGGLIAAVNCFADKKNALKKDAPVTCTVTADEVFEKYVTQLEEQLDMYFPLYSTLNDDYKFCLEIVRPALNYQFLIDKDTFETCVLKELNITYTLNV